MMEYALFVSCCLVVYVYRNLCLARKEVINQQSFARKLLANTESDRRRIARELHDQIGQGVILLKQKVGREVSPESAGILDELIEDVRSISTDLYSPALSNLGFTNAVWQLVDWYDRNTNLFLTADIEEVDYLLDEFAAGHLFLLLKEGLYNVIKHAESTAARLEVKVVGQELQFCLRDYGKGFTTRTIQNSAGIGLLMMKERAAIIGADIFWRFPAGGGTMVMLKKAIE